jgi:hypothetical protein
MSLRVVQPCPKRWDDLHPAQDGRYCGACDRTVVDIERLTAAEVGDLLASGEKLCARLAVLPDGSPLTRDHPRSPLRPAWVGRGLAAAVAASALACSPPAEPAAEAPPAEETAAETCTRPAPDRPEELRPLTEEEIEMLRMLGYVS